MQAKRTVQRKLKHAMRPATSGKGPPARRAVRHATVDPVTAEIIRGAM